MGFWNRILDKGFFGLTENQLHKRISSHKTSFNRAAYKNSTKLSIAIWKLKEAIPPIPYQLKFSIAQLARSYTREAQFCFLCAAEKAKIAFADPATTLNFRSEIMNKCPHRRKHLLENWTWGFKPFLFFFTSKVFKRLTRKNNEPKIL